jgi:cold shock CspA family protein
LNKVVYLPADSPEALRSLASERGLGSADLIEAPSALVATVETLVRDLQSTGVRAFPMLMKESENSSDFSVGVYLAVYKGLGVFSGRLSGHETSSQVLETVMGDLQASIIERLGQAWPLCRQHASHSATIDEVTGERWRCPATGADLGAVGSLGRHHVLPRELPPGRLRWWNPVGGYGVISDPDGDVWFGQDALYDLSAEALDGAEGLALTYEVGGSQGAFRRAIRVGTDGQVSDLHNARD